jgi:hypothetical protein
MRDNPASMTATMTREVDTEVPAIAIANVDWVLRQGTGPSAALPIGSDDVARVWHDLVDARPADLAAMRAAEERLVAAFSAAYGVGERELDDVRAELRRLRWRRRIEEGERRARDGDVRRACRLLLDAVRHDPTAVTDPRTAALVRQTVAALLSPGARRS